LSTESFIESAVRESGDFAGFFEYDGETGYFYLYGPAGAAGKKVLGAIHICSGPPDFALTDVEVRWDLEERCVGVFIEGLLCAAFNCDDGSRYGGDFDRSTKSFVPPEIELGFRHAS